MKHVDLTLPRGSITVLLGENGAGKSTLLRIIAGLTTPSYGQVTRFGGQPGKVAYMAHASMLYDELSARENLDYFANLAKTADDCGCAASPEMALRAVGLDPHMTRPVGQFSQGMRQRALACARAADGPGVAAARRAVLESGRRQRGRYRGAAGGLQDVACAVGQNDHSDKRIRLISPPPSPTAP